MVAFPEFEASWDQHWATPWVVVVRSCLTWDSSQHKDVVFFRIPDVFSAVPQVLYRTFVDPK